MKILVLGYGSIGRRHVANLRELQVPVESIIIADPLFDGASSDPQWHPIDHGSMAVFTDWRLAIRTHPDADAAIIASPTMAHGEQMGELAKLDIPFYVEKPLGTSSLPVRLPKRCAVGFQYRWHEAWPHLARMAGEYDELRFYARDNLLDRYGPHVADVMGSHPIDTALALLGDAEKVSLHSNGAYLRGRIEHQRGRVSLFDLDISTGPRESRVSAGHETVELTADPHMYVKALAVWLGWVLHGVSDSKLAKLPDGLAVECVLAEVRIG